jgi:hypothetical protein
MGDKIYMTKGRDYCGDFYDCEVPARSVSDARNKMEKSKGVLSWEFQRDQYGHIYLKDGSTEKDI